MRTLLCLLLVLLSAGCGEDFDLGGPVPTPFWVDGGDASDSSGGDGGTRAADAAADGSTADSLVDSSDGAPDSPDSGDASGPTDQYYVSWLETAQQLQDPSPFGDSWVEQRTTTLGLIKVQWTGNSGQRWHQPCAMHTNSNFNTDTLYSAAFLSAIPVTQVAIERQGTTWTQAEELQTVGLKSDYTGPMPALGESGHAALVDADKDGLPGVTVYIDNSLLGKQNLQVGQRSKTTWIGAVQGNGDVTAEPKVQTEQVVVAASLSLLVTKNNVKPLQGKPAETLLWRPLSTPIDCKTLLAAPQQYIGRAWPP